MKSESINYFDCCCLRMIFNISFDFVENLFFANSSFSRDGMRRKNDLFDAKNGVRLMQGGDKGWEDRGKCVRELFVYFGNATNSGPGENKRKMLA